MRRTLVLAVVIGILLASTAFVDAQVRVKLRFWNGWGGARIPLMEKMIADFEALYPWIEVENEVISLGNERIERLILAVASGSVPDVVMIDRADIPMFVRKGILHPLDEYIEKDGLDTSIFYEPEIASSRYAGSTYVLPIPTAGAKQLLFVNNDIFAESGLSEQDIPRTWAELEEVSRKVTRREADGSLEILAFDPLFVPDAGWDFWLFSNGGTIVSEDLRTVKLVTPEAISTLEWIRSFVDVINGGIEAMQAHAAKYTSGFADGRVAMSLRGSWDWYILRQTVPDINMALAMPPAGPNGKSINLVDKGWGYGIPKGAPHPYESWLLIKYMTTAEEAACWFMREQARPSPVIACNQDPELVESNPYMHVIGEALMAGYQIPITPIHSQLFAEIRTVTSPVMRGQSILGVLQETERRAQAMLDEAWAEE